MSTIKNGDWVKTKEHGIYGYVEEHGDGYFYMKSEEIVQAKHVGLKVHKNEIELMDSSLKEEDKELLIDLALQARDKEWFIELIS